MSPSSFGLSIPTAVGYWSLGLASVVLACPLAGCQEGYCTVDQYARSRCSRCLDGYYIAHIVGSCNTCHNRCSSCDTWDKCLACKAGYYLESASQFCCSCPDMCAECSSASVCSLACFEGSTSANCIKPAVFQRTNVIQNDQLALVVAIIAGSVLGLALIAFVFWFILRGRLSSRIQQQAANTAVQENSEISPKIKRGSACDNLDIQSSIESSPKEPATSLLPATNQEDWIISSTGPNIGHSKVQANRSLIPSRLYDPRKSTPEAAYEKVEQSKKYSVVGSMKSIQPSKQDLILFSKSKFVPENKGEPKAK